MSRIRNTLQITAKVLSKSEQSKFDTLFDFLRMFEKRDLIITGRLDVHERPQSKRTIVRFTIQK
jgi:hypothetical protein